MKSLARTAVFGIAIGLGGCISSQEMPLAPNVVRIDTQARGLLFTGQTVPHTMRAAAQATLDRGYTHFRFADASLSQGSVVTGAVANSSGSFSGSYQSGYFQGNSTGFGTVSAIRAPTASAGVTVIMYRATDPGAKDAFDAAEILKQYPR